MSVPSEFATDVTTPDAPASEPHWMLPKASVSKTDAVLQPVSVEICKPFALITRPFMVEEADVALSRVSCTPPVKVDVPAPATFKEFATSALPATAKSAPGVEVPTPTLPPAVTTNAVEVAPALEVETANRFMFENVDVA